MIAIDVLLQPIVGSKQRPLRRNLDTCIGRTKQPVHISSKHIPSWVSRWRKLHVTKNMSIVFTVSDPPNDRVYHNRHASATEPAGQRGKHGCASKLHGKGEARGGMEAWIHWRPPQGHCAPNNVRGCFSKAQATNETKSRLHRKPVHRRATRSG